MSIANTDGSKEEVAVGTDLIDLEKELDACQVFRSEHPVGHAGGFRINATQVWRICGDAADAFLGEELNGIGSWSGPASGLSRQRFNPKVLIIGGGFEMLVDVAGLKDDDIARLERAIVFFEAADVLGCDFRGAWEIGAGLGVSQAANIDYSSWSAGPVEWDLIDGASRGAAGAVFGFKFGEPAADFG